MFPQISHRLGSFSWWVLALVFGFLGYGTEPSAAATLSVGGGYPYSRIQAAVDAAQNGDTIFIAQGLYKEDVRIFKTGSGTPYTLTITGQGTDPQYVVLKGTLEIAIYNGSSNINVRVAVSNLTIQGPTNLPFGGGVPAASGIYVVGDPVIISNCVIKDEQYGVYLTPSNTQFGAIVTLSRTLITKNQFGVMVTGDSTLTVSNSVVVGNGTGIVGGRTMLVRDSFFGWNGVGLGGSGLGGIKLSSGFPSTSSLTMSNTWFQRNVPRHVGIDPGYTVFTDLGGNIYRDPSTISGISQ